MKTLQLVVNDNDARIVSGSPYNIAYIGSTALKFRPPRNGASRGQKMTYGRFSEQDIALLNVLAASKDLLAACKDWLDYFDKLNAQSDPSDPLSIERNKCHGPRIEATRAAIARATGQKP